MLKLMILGLFIFSYTLSGESDINVIKTNFEPPEPPKTTLLTKATWYEIKADVTKYGWTGNTMANGEYPYIGAVASSDRSIPFGTRVEIDGKVYEVKDRTALWVHKKFGLTFDIYSEDTEERMLEFGRQDKIVRILTQ